jgi:hypothetical protein
MPKPLVTLASACLFVALGAEVHAAEQGLVTKLLVVRDPTANPQAKKILWRVRQKGDDDLSLVGDPTVGGAKLRIRLQVSNHCSQPPCDEGGGDQCFDLPASAWSPIGSIGFKYTDPALANGAVKVVSIKHTPAGTFVVKALLEGAGIDLFLEDEIGFYGLNLALGGGDAYFSGSGGATPKPNDSQTFRVRNEDGTASLSACSPSGAFVD